MWELIGGWLWRIFWALVLLACVHAVAESLYEFLPAVRARRQKAFDDNIGRPFSRGHNIPRRARRLGCFGYGFAIVVGYVAWVAITMPLD